LFDGTLLQCLVQRQWVKQYSNSEDGIFVIPAITWPENVMDDPDFEKMENQRKGNGFFSFMKAANPSPS